METIITRGREPASGSSEDCSNSFSSSGIKNATLTVVSDNLTRSATCPVSINQPVNIICHTNSDCGTNGITGSPFCQGNNVYQNFKTHTCNNPGTANSYCSNSTSAQLKTTCTGNQTCSNGSCNNVNIACSANTDCGTNGITGSPFCQGNNVYQNYITYTCNSAGTANSYCSNSTNAQLTTTCTGNQTCSNGSCVNQNNLIVSCYATPNPVNANQSVTFIPNILGGNGGAYSYSWSGACSGSSANCTNSFSGSGSQTATVTVTSGSQTGSASCSVNVNQNCTNHSYQRCSGNNLYWYDSCGNQQDSQYCSNGCYNNSCQNNYNNITVQTNSATNASNNQATLNGYLYNNSNNNYSCNDYVWFQWGNTSSYGYETVHQQQNYTGTFSQNIVLNTYNFNNNSYHFRAAAQDCQGNTVYGQDMVIYNNNVGGNLVVSKTVRNLTTGSNWANSTYASPLDTVMFMITLQATSNQDVQNVFVRDNLPVNLVYKNQLVVSWSNNYNNYNNSNNYSGDIMSGINLNTIPAGQTVVITYQAQVAGAQNFSYGTTTLTNNVTVSSSQSGYTPTSNASVIVNRTGVYGASTISTGLTNNFWVDSFFLPLLIALFGIWIWKSGLFFGIENMACR